MSKIVRSCSVMTLSIANDNSPYLAFAFFEPSVIRGGGEGGGHELPSS